MQNQSKLRRLSDSRPSHISDHRNSKHRLHRDSLASLKGDHRLLRMLHNKLTDHTIYKRRIHTTKVMTNMPIIDICNHHPLRQAMGKNTVHDPSNMYKQDCRGRKYHIEQIRYQTQIQTSYIQFFVQRTYPIQEP